MSYGRYKSANFDAILPHFFAIKIIAVCYRPYFHVVSPKKTAKHSKNSDDVCAQTAASNIFNPKGLMYKYFFNQLP